MKKLVAASAMVALCLSGLAYASGKVVGDQLKSATTQRLAMIDSI